MATSLNSRFRVPATHGYVRVCACTPRVALANPAANVAVISGLAKRAARQGAAVIVFPELSLSGYSNEDLFFQDALLDAVEEGLERLIADTVDLEALLIVGAPVRAQDALFNCAVLLLGGRVVAVVPKSYLPNYREFYEKRYFAAAAAIRERAIRLCGQEVPFGNDLLVAAPAICGLSLHVEICEDFWVPIPPSAGAALAGATLLVNLSASNATIAKADYRKLLAASQSGAALRPISTVPPAMGNPPPTWPGTDRR